MAIQPQTNPTPIVVGGRLRVGVAVDGVGAYGRGVLCGVLRYVAKHGGWMPLFQPIDSFDPRTHTANLGGLIVQVKQPEHSAHLKDLAIPVVNVGDVAGVEPLPRIHSDHQAIGGIVADYFISRQLRSLAFLGYPGAWYAQQRYMGFHRLAAKHGIKTAVLWTQGESFFPEVRRWLLSLPKPVALMGCDDSAASRAMLVGSDAGLRIPYDLAIIGVDNDELIWQADIPLASVAVAADKIGYEAARQLDRMLAGGRKASRPMIIPPKGLVLRQSADVLAVEDDLVAQAVGLIHHHTSRTLAVEDVLAVLKVSRRTLEKHFKTVLGYTPAEEIRRTRVTRATQLLISTELPLATIAYDCGFVDASHFSHEFRRLMGMTPGQYRQRASIRS